MIIGEITAFRQPLLPITVYGATEEQVLTIPFLVDTGFEGYLTLPLVIIEVLGLTAVNPNEIRLGDGTIREVQRFLIEVDWHGVRFSVPVIQLEEIPVVGMRLLYGRDIFIKNSDGGPVLVI